MTPIGTVKNRVLYYQKFGIDSTWYKRLPKANWVLLVIANNIQKTKLFEISRRAIENNACYICCVGKQGELLHDIIDDDIIVRGVEIENNYLPPFDIITTWHKNIENALWFSIYTAYNDPIKIDNIICLDSSEDDTLSMLSNLCKRFEQGYIPLED